MSFVRQRYRLSFPAAAEYLGALDRDTSPPHLAGSRAAGTTGTDGPSPMPGAKPSTVAASTRVTICSRLNGAIAIVPRGSRNCASRKIPRTIRRSRDVLGSARATSRRHSRCRRRIFCGGGVGGQTMSKRKMHPEFDGRIITPVDLILNDEGKMKPLLANAITVLRTAPEWENVLAYNEFSSHVTTKFPAPWQAGIGAVWSDYDDSKTCEWLQHHGVMIRTHIATEAIEAIAKENPFHPVRDYLKNVRWDGEPRIDHWLIRYVGAPDIPFVRAVGPRWFISGVARIFKPGCQADHMLLFEGPQGIRKSTLLRILASDDRWFSDHVSELGSKDSRGELQGKWILEMGELDNIRRSDLERVKTFLTTRADNFRPPYGRRTESFPRQCVFAGTVNDHMPLIDETGNRRFWPVRCGTIDLKALERDRDLLWAEAYDRYQAGSVWWLDTAELNDLALTEQESRYNPGPWDELITAWIAAPTQSQSPDGEHGTMLPVEPFDSKPGAVTTTDILLHALGKKRGQFTPNDQNQVVRCLIHAGWQRDKKQERIDDRRVRFFRPS